MTADEAKILAELEYHCSVAGVSLRECGHGHYHIRGVQLVNYWPFSKRKVVHIAGTDWRRSHQSPADAVDLAVNPLKKPVHKSWPVDGPAPVTSITIDGVEHRAPSPTGRINQEDPQIHNLPGTLAASIERFEARHGSPPWGK